MKKVWMLLAALMATSQAGAETESGAVFKDCDICPEMVVIPEGSFGMGSNKHDYTQPVHTVNIKAFHMQTHEVTFEQWDACVEAGYCPWVDDAGHDEDTVKLEILLRGISLEEARKKSEKWGRGSRPVINVSYLDITERFIPWLNHVTGQGYRLPTEAEWEYAARSGSAKKYSWGDRVGSNNANCDGCGSQWDNEKTAPVKSFSPNKWGLYDMHGNVAEWVQDCSHENYIGAPEDGSAWVSMDKEDPACEAGILRGGAWMGKPVSMTSFSRGEERRNSGLNHVGFRLAKDI